MFHSTWQDRNDIVAAEGSAMKAFLTEGAAEVLGGIGAAVKLFWPVAFGYLAMVLISAVAGFFAALESTAATVALLLSGVAGAVYVFLALCQGAVGWHRRVLLKQTASWISPIPRRRSLKYALAVLTFVIIFLIGHMAISSFTLPYLHSIFTSSLGGIDLTNAPVEVLERWRLAVWPIQIATLASAIVLTSVVLWFGRTWLPVFPYISIRSTEPHYGAIKEGLNHSAGLVGALLIVYFLPSILGTIYSVAVPMSVQLHLVPSVLMTILGVVIYFFCFLWGLSILSLAYRRAVAVPETNHAD
jgi:MFS family permease